MPHLCRDAISRCLLLVLLLCLVPASGQQTASGNSNPVALLLTVIDKESKKFIKTLSKEDVRVAAFSIPNLLCVCEQESGWQDA
jgi:hypothetical protein